jgi:hypothetical protein
MQIGGHACSEDLIVVIQNEKLSQEYFVVLSAIGINRSIVKHSKRRCRFNLTLKGPPPNFSAGSPISSNSPQTV